MDNQTSKQINPDQVDQWIQDTMNGNRPGQLLPVADIADMNLRSQTKQIVGTIVDYKELMMMYTCAMKEIRTKFDVLNTEFTVRYRRNPISFISTRLKKTSSIIQKLTRKNLIFSLDSITQNIHDVAGVRVICPYIDDIYILADALLKQDDITLVDRKDYIRHPKPNGYRSLHLIVSVPVFFSDQTRNMEVEVQIRTIAMDFWASLEHQLKYKQTIPNQQEIVSQLKACADTISQTDTAMQNLRHQIEDMTDTPTEEDILLEKLSRLDIAID